MRSFALTDHPAFSTTASPYFPEHVIFTSKVSDFVIPEHRCHHGLIYSLGGTFSFTLHGLTRTLDENKFLIVNGNSTFGLHVGSPVAQPMMLYFQSRTPALSLGSDAADWNLTERIYPVTDVFKERIHVLASLPDSCSSFITMKADAVIRSILFEILSFNQYASNESMKLDVRKVSTRQENYKRLAVVREWIEDNFNRTLTLDELAGIAAMNHQHFLRLFHKVFHKTPHQYIIDRRIAEAKQLLLDPGMVVADVCLAIGWDSLSTFSQLFKQRTGQTPGEYRKASGGDHILE
jgi:AraC family transcriptional regulator